MLLPADAVRVCGAPANLPAAPHTPSSGMSSSSSQHGPMAPAPHSGWVSAQAFGGAQWAMGSASVSSPSLCRCTPAAEAKSCVLHSPLVSAVDGEMPGLSRPGQRPALRKCECLLARATGSCCGQWQGVGHGWCRRQQEDQHSHADGTAELSATVLLEGRQHGWPRAASVTPAHCRLGTCLRSWR